MPLVRRARSLLATLVGYVLVAVLAYVAFQILVGTLYWVFRMVILAVLVVGLLSLYLKLKSPDGD